MLVRITKHAIDRYRERISDVPAAEAEAIILKGLRGAKAKHLRAIHQRTRIIPTEDCFLICSRGVVVSVLPLDHRWRNSA